jgi:hypothetical protein
MSGGVISGNEQWDAGYKGGGVYVGGSTSNFNMSVSALIEGNTAAGGGKGVYVNDGVFKMSGGARVAPDNDVFLAADKFITIDGALTKTTPVATITPQTYTEYLRVLGGNPTLVAAAVKKFALSLPYSGGWYIADGGNGTEGTIRKKVASRVVDNAPYYYETLAAAIAATPENSHTAITIYDHILITERIIIPANKQITLTVSPMIIITLNRDSAYTGAFFEVTGSASLTLSAPVAGELILDGMGGAVTARESLVYVNADGNFTLKSGAVLRNNMFDRDGVLGGGAVCNQGTFTMEGGKITGNKKSGNSVAWGGGVYSAGTFTMSGGEISNNSVSCHQFDGPQGAGVHIAAGTFNMSDGIISGNNDIGSPYSCIGGGVYNGAGSFTMSGGVIYGLDANSPTLANTVSGLGGTLYLTGSSSAKYGNNTDIPNPYDDTLYGSY